MYFTMLAMMLFRNSAPVWLICQAGSRRSRGYCVLCCGMGLGVAPLVPVFMKRLCTNVSQDSIREIFFPVFLLLFWLCD